MRGIARGKLREEFPKISEREREDEEREKKRRVENAAIKNDIQPGPGNTSPARRKYCAAELATKFDNVGSYRNYD